jgi:hypothetical protein
LPIFGLKQAPKRRQPEESDPTANGWDPAPSGAILSCSGTEAGSPVASLIAVECRFHLGCIGYKPGLLSQERRLLEKGGSQFLGASSNKFRAMSCGTSALRSLQANLKRVETRSPSEHHSALGGVESLAIASAVSWRGNELEQFYW